MSDEEVRDKEAEIAAHARLLALMFEAGHARALFSQHGRIQESREMRSLLREWIELFGEDRSS